MSIIWLEVMLEGLADETTGDELFEQVGLEPDAGFESRTSWPGHHPAAVVFLDARPLDESPEQHRAFWDGIDRAFERAAAWLSSRAPGAFDAWRAAGRCLAIKVF
jgi:hypothetical protein